MAKDKNGTAFGVGARVRTSSGVEFTVTGAHPVPTKPAQVALASQVEVIGDDAGAVALGDGDGDNLVWGT